MFVYLLKKKSVNGEKDKSARPLELKSCFCHVTSVISPVNMCSAIMIFFSELNFKISFQLIFYHAIFHLLSVMSGKMNTLQVQIFCIWVSIMFLAVST